MRLKITCLSVSLLATLGVMNACNAAPTFSKAACEGSQYTCCKWAGPDNPWGANPNQWVKGSDCSAAGADAVPSTQCLRRDIVFGATAGEEKTLVNECIQFNN